MTRKFVLISHSHGDHDQGAAQLQSRFGAKVVMDAADWNATLQRPATAAGYIFRVNDGNRTLMVAYAGGTAFNFAREAGNFTIYRDSQQKMLAGTRAAGATVLMSNHTEFDRAYDRARIAQLPRAAARSTVTKPCNAISRWVPCAPKRSACRWPTEQAPTRNQSQINDR